MRFLRRFGAFWYGFVIGDDWTVAVGVVAALALTALLAHRAVSSWWVSTGFPFRKTVTVSPSISPLSYRLTRTESAETSRSFVYTIFLRVNFAIRLLSL